MSIIAGFADRVTNWVCNPVNAATTAVGAVISQAVISRYFQYFDLPPGTGLFLAQAATHVGGQVVAHVGRSLVSAAPPHNPGASRTKEEIDIQVGSSNCLVDGIRNFLSIPWKILILNSKVNSGNVSGETIEKVRDFLHENGLHDVSVSVNQYKPQEVWRRIFTNPKTSLLSKCTGGILVGLLSTLAIPKLTGLIPFCDNYSPFENTVHLFSDDPALALHECGHAKDFNERANPGLYTLTKALPGVGPYATLYQEYNATDNAMQYFRGKNLSADVKRALKILVPAYASYCAEAVLTSGTIFDTTYLLLGCAGIIAAGHVIGHILAACEPENKPAEQAAPPATAAEAPALAS